MVDRQTSGKFAPARSTQGSTGLEEVGARARLYSLFCKQKTTAAGCGWLVPEFRTCSESFRIQFFLNRFNLKIISLQRVVAKKNVLLESVCVEHLGKIKVHIYAKNVLLVIIIMYIGVMYITIFLKLMQKLCNFSYEYYS